jgi:hypothetical protein
MCYGCTCFCRTVSRLGENDSVPIQGRQEVNAVTLDQTLNFIIKGRVRQDVICQLERNFRSNHFVTTNAADDFDGGLQV